MIPTFISFYLLKLIPFNKRLQNIQQNYLEDLPGNIVRKLREISIVIAAF